MESERLDLGFDMRNRRPDLGSSRCVLGSERPNLGLETFN